MQAFFCLGDRSGSLAASCDREAPMEFEEQSLSSAIDRVQHLITLAMSRHQWQG